MEGVSSIPREGGWCGGLLGALLNWSSKLSSLKQTGGFTETVAPTMRWQPVNIIEIVGWCHNLQRKAKKRNEGCPTAIKSHVLLLFVWLSLTDWLTLRAFSATLVIFPPPSFTFLTKLRPACTLHTFIHTIGRRYTPEIQIEKKKEIWGAEKKKK